MQSKQLRTAEEIAEIYERQGKTVYRICFLYMKNPADAEDAVQDTFFKLIKSGPVFENREHEKAWLIRTASNTCKNAVRHWWRRRESIEDHCDIPCAEDGKPDEVIEAVLALPDKYKTVIVLYYYEGYTSAEIAEILQKPPSTVRNYLHEARTILKKRLGDDFYEEQ